MPDRHVWSLHKSYHTTTTSVCILHFVFFSVFNGLHMVGTVAVICCFNMKYRPVYNFYIEIRRLRKNHADRNKIVVELINFFL